MKIMTYNVLRDARWENGDRRERVARLIDDAAPDVLCMQEGGDDQFWTQWARDKGYTCFVNAVGEYSPAIFARERPERAEVHPIAKGTPYIQLARGARTMGIYSVHLQYQCEADAVRLAELDAMFEAMTRRQDDFVCMAGDFNSRTLGEWGEAWWLEVMRQRNTNIDRSQWVQATRRMAERGFVDGYRRFTSESGCTWHPTLESVDRLGEKGRDVPLVIAHREPDPPVEFTPAAVRIDYIFANAPLADDMKQCELIDSEEAYLASDHLPLVATFDFSG